MTDIVKTLNPAEVAAAMADASKISANTVNVADVAGGIRPQLLCGRVSL